MKLSGRHKAIRQFLLDNIDDHPQDVVRVAAHHFEVSRQTISNQLKHLVEERLVTARGNTKARQYSLRKNTEKVSLPVIGLQEDIVWRDHVRPHIKDDIGRNILDICEYGVTEMVNNVIDHSEADEVHLTVVHDPVKVGIYVRDAGVGIFNKIQQDFGLLDPRHALLELAKGKLTSDEKRHSGQGVFFTSRMFDEFTIRSGNLYYERVNAEDDEWLIEVLERGEARGTVMGMRIWYNSTQTIKEVFDQYTSADGDYGFTKTHVPVKLVLYEGNQMMSRSQAKRILAHVEKFREVILDFSGVTQIGQAFADEMFRVYARGNPNVELIPIHTTPEIDKMIQHVESDARQLGLFDKVTE